MRRATVILIMLQTYRAGREISESDGCILPSSCHVGRARSYLQVGQHPYLMKYKSDKLALTDTVNNFQLPNPVDRANHAETLICFLLEKTFFPNACLHFPWCALSVQSVSIEGCDYNAGQLMFTGLPRGYCSELAASIMRRYR